MARREQEHAYRTCEDEDCPQFPCRVYKEGYRDGYAAGYLDGSIAGYAAGYAEGFAAGVAAERADA